MLGRHGIDPARVPGMAAAHPAKRQVTAMRRAMLALSGGNLGRLGYYLAAAQRDYRDVLYWAQHPDQAPRQ